MLATIFSALVFTLLLTNWLVIVRARWGLDRWPLAGDMVALAPTLVGVLAAWTCMYPAELAVRKIVVAHYAQRTGVAPRPWSLGTYLQFKIRHQILIVLAPMCLVLLAKFFVRGHRVEILRLAPRIAWLPDAMIGTAAALVVLISPVILRYLWVTSPLPRGALRDRLEAMCRRVGLRYREILVWESQGLMVNAAVMGLFAPVRYVLLSDGLLATMSERQIEAVFGHEAGHVRRHHLLFFGMFAVLSMLAVGGVLEVIIRYVSLSDGSLQLIGLAILLGIWGLAFGWISRKFERQADLYGTLSVTPDASECEPGCRVHGAAGRSDGSAVCMNATRLFGRTLMDVARFNGIPADANSWRHGSIRSRCELLAAFATSPGRVREFEAGVERVKIAMTILTLIGCGVAVWMYWPF